MSAALLAVLSRGTIGLDRDEEHNDDHDDDGESVCCQNGNIRKILTFLHN